MRPPRVVECQIPAQAFSGGRDAVVGAQIDLLVFDRSPQPLDKDIVAPGVFAVHTDLDFGVLQRLDEVDRGELADLIRIHDIRLEVIFANRAQFLVQAAQADLQQLSLLVQAQALVTVRHFLVLGNRPALSSAPSKKSFSSVNWPIFACNNFTSISGSFDTLGLSPKTPVTPSRSWSFYCLIWFGCMSNCVASSLIVLSPF